MAGVGLGPQAKVTIHSWRCLWRMIFSWDIGIADAYIAGEWSSPDLVALLKLACNNSALAEPLKALRAPPFWLRLRHAMNRNTRRGSRRNIAAHYDLGNEFYQQWLDPGMTYSAALFSRAGQALEEAQDAKLDRVISLLDLAGGEKVLEIGCGWGGFAERLLQQHDGTVTGITLSSEQLAFAKRRLRNRAAAGRCDLRLQDYRDVRGTFDRIVSIEMMEAVGEAYWSIYFEKLRASLRPGGSAVLQVITIDEARFENYRRRPDFIQKYIFPGGMLPTRSGLSSAKFPKPDFGLSFTSTSAKATRERFNTGNSDSRNPGQQSSGSASMSVSKEPGNITSLIARLGSTHEY